MTYNFLFVAGKDRFGIASSQGKGERFEFYYVT